MYSEIFFSCHLFHDPTPSCTAQYGVMTDIFRSHGQSRDSKVKRLTPRRSPDEQNIRVRQRHAHHFPGTWKIKWRKRVWGQAELPSETLPPAKDVKRFFHAGNGKVLKTDARSTEENLRKVIVWILVLFTFNRSRESWCFKSKQNIYFQSRPSHMIYRPKMSWIWTSACSK